MNEVRSGTANLLQVVSGTANLSQVVSRTSSFSLIFNLTGLKPFKGGQSVIGCGQHLTTNGGRNGYALDSKELPSD